MSTTRIGAAALAALLFAPAGAAAWDRTGHEVVARIAWERLSPAVREEAVRLLEAIPADGDLGERIGARARHRGRLLFQEAGYWPDAVRDRRFPARKARYDQPDWHYQAYFWEPSSDPAGYRERADLLPAPGILVERLSALSAELADAGRPDPERGIALAWLIHLVADVHQPLHCGSRVTPEEPEGDQGANLFELTGGEKLHSYWDGILNRTFRRRFWESSAARIGRISRALARRHPPPADLMPNDFSAWARAGQATARASLFPPGLERRREPGPGYLETAAAIAEPAVALAGYRLADLLQRALGR